MSGGRKISVFGGIEPGELVSFWESELYGPNDNTRGRLFITDGLNYNRNHKDSNRSNRRSNCSGSGRNICRSNIRHSPQYPPRSPHHNNRDNIRDNRIRASSSDQP